MGFKTCSWDLCTLQTAAIQHKLPKFPHCEGVKCLVIADHIEVPLPGRIADLKDLDVQPQQHVHVGYHSDAEALRHQAGYDLVFLRFVCDLWITVNLSKKLFHYIPQAGAFRKVDVWI